MNFIATKEQRQYMERENRKHGVRMQPVERAQWPTTVEKMSQRPVEGVWRSRDFLAVAYRDKESIVCLSINRTRMKGRTWEDGITWDELQRIKSECGFGHLDAVEMYPRDQDVVNVANIRHLWIFENALVEFAWRKDVNPTL